MKRSTALALAALLSLPFAAVAQPAEIAAADDSASLQEQARQLHEESAAIRHAADDQHVVAQKACWKKFLVTACLDEAGQAFRNERSKANALESRAGGIERELKRRQVAERDAKRAEKDAAQAAKP
jgi:colicin import membrane protein